MQERPLFVQSKPSVLSKYIQTNNKVSAPMYDLQRHLKDEWIKNDTVFVDVIRVEVPLWVKLLKANHFRSN